MNHRRNKYRVANRDRRTWNGKVYASRAEMLYAQLLGAHREDGAIVEIEEQPLVTLGVPENRYRPDFRVVDCDGVTSWVDVKGVETTMFRRNMRLWKAYGPGPLLVVRHVRDGRFKTMRTILPVG